MKRMRLTVSSQRTGEDAEIVQLEGYAPQIERVSSSGLTSIAAMSDTIASSCIYCGSSARLSNEHVIPYALGGTFLIVDGSCEVCRQVTQKFENSALNQGSMREARYVTGLQSRTKHANAQREVAISLVRSGFESTETFATDELPLLLSLPCFSVPVPFDFRVDGRIGLNGWATLRFGPDEQDFLHSVGASEMHFQEPRKNPVAFARMIAKIAFGFAWHHKVVELLDGPCALVNAFMHCPNELGHFVGAQSPPFRQFSGLDFRIEYQYDPAKRIVFMEVQLFPDAATPTYLVVLGHCSTHRCWRDVRKRIALHQ